MGKTKTSGENGLKLNYGKTILMGFAFMASSIAWGVYDPFVTKILNRMLGASPTIAHWSEALVNKAPFLLKLMEAQGENVGSAAKGFTLVPLFIGIIMTFDNVFGVIFQPTFGKLSDRCHTRFGKRKPFIMFGAPVAAALFLLIPRMEHLGSIPALMTCIILFVFVMSLWRAPCVALMPDLTPPSLRSEGNAVINLVGGVGSMLALVAATIVCAVYKIPNNTEHELLYTPHVFEMAAVIMVVCTLVVTFLVKEPDSRLHTAAERNKDADAAARRAAEKQARKEEKQALKAMKLTKGERTSLILMLCGLFFLFCGSNSIQTYFSLFAEEILGKSTGEATKMMALFAISTALGALPAGFLGKKIGRKKTILLGLGLFIAAFIVYLTVGNASASLRLGLVYAALILGGFANMLITVNTLPLVLEIGGIAKVGTFTGYYYTATFSAQIATPIVYGVVRVLTGTYASLFIYCPICFTLSLLCILGVRHGEAIPDEIIKEAEMADD
ncbi:MAG: MFS transporter [Clostridia bacterium]|nr:MFS transporter [Clostridia bacterium]